MGETKKKALRVDFDRRLKLEFHGANITSDAGLLAYRELDDALGLTDMSDETLDDPRTGHNILHPMTALLRQAVYGRLAGYSDTNDAERLRQDPAMRQIVGGRARHHKCASTTQMSRFETEFAASPRNLFALSELSGQWIDRVNRHERLDEIILDIDSSESPTHGEQEGSLWNGHFAKTCYHPLFCFNQFGDLERAMLRPGNVHSAKDWRQLLEPVIDRYRTGWLKRYARFDAAFALPEIYEFLEFERYGYAIRLPSNEVLGREIEHLMTRPVGRPSSKPQVFYHDFMYRAQSWDRSRRVIAKVQWHCGELFPRVGFIVTNLDWSPQQVVRFYNQRGTAEQWIKEGKQAVRWTRLSCHDFRDNEVRLQLFALAYNLGNFLRTLALPKKIAHWSMTTLKEKLIKIGAKVTSSGRYLTFQMAEVAVSRPIFNQILKNIAKLRAPPAWT